MWIAENTPSFEGNCPILTTIGFKQFQDHHLFHLTFKNLQKIVLDNGFAIDDVYWQPGWRDTVCYVTAILPAD
jgi:hypothetical protein